MSTNDATSAPSDDAPLSLSDLFNAEVGGEDVAAPHRAEREAAADPQSAVSFDTPASSDTPEDPEDLDHEDEEDDVEHATPENDPEDESDDDEDDSQDELEEDEVDGHAPFIEDGSQDEDEEPAEKKPEEITFADLGLPDDLLKAVTSMGFVTPTDIQREAIPVLISGRDVVGVAQTGTGKTAAFGLPLLDAVDSSAHEVQALVLAPTRELALQSADAISDMAQHSRGLDVVAVYGGSPYGPQIGALKGGAQVVVGTPGRVIDLIEKGALRLENVRYLVLDEADEMLRMGFAEDVETIAGSLPSERRTALFSATMPPAIQKVARHHMTDPVQVQVSRQASTVDTVHQAYAVVPFRHKVGAVSRVLAVTEAAAAIVFVRTKSTAEDVAIELAGRGIQAAAISGDVAQRERERLVERLRNGTLDVLVATDVAARGLDVDRIGLVVNFDVPREAEAYVHRIGRTGRAGRHGEAITFLTPKEKGKLRQIERLTGTRLEEVTLPSPADVSQHRASKLLERAAARHERGRLGIYTSLVSSRCEELAVSVEELAATLLALSVGDEGPHRREDAEDGGKRQRVQREENVDSEGTFVSASFELARGERASSRRDNDRPSAARGGRRQAEGPGTTYRVEVGHRDRVLPGAIVGALANEGGISGSDIGKIDILQSFSLVTIHTDLSEDQLKRMGHATFGGRELRIRPDGGPGQGWDGPNDNAPSSATERRSGRPYRDNDGERGGFRKRYDRDGERGGRDERRGGSWGNRDGGRDSRGGERSGYQGGGYQGGRSNDRDGSRDSRGGERGGFRENRGGYQGGRDDRGGRDERRGGSWGNRDGGRDSRGSGDGARETRGGERSGYQGGRDDRGGSRFGGNRSGGYRGNRDNRGDRGGSRW